MAKPRSDKIKRIRASKPKVRSGCITCKIRRVKCDEGKPGCLRCQKFGRECDGYAEEKPVAKVVSLTPIRPRPATLPVHAPAFLVPGNEQERRYFQIFCDRTAPDLAGYFPTEFWSSIVLQQSHSEPAIRHVVVALGALTKTLLDAELQPSAMGSCNPYNSSCGSLIEHHEFALSQYSKAIANLRQTLAKGKPAIRTALIASLLFVCFENFHGDHDAAGQQVQSGLGLIDQWQAQVPPIGYGGSSRQRRMNTLLDDEVFQMFARLESQAFSHLGSEKNMHPNPRMLLWENVDPDSFEIPPMFNNVTEARNCFDYLSQRCVNFHNMNTPYRYASINDPWDGPDWIRTEREVCISQLRAFEDALLPIMSLAPGDVASEHGPLVLYLCNKICTIYMYASIGTGEYIFDEFMHDFEDIVVRSRPIIEKSRQDATSPTAAFSFEAGIVPPLHLTALKCRNGQIRRQAIALLLSCPRREGKWDGLVLGKVDAWLMALEEQGMDAYGFIPEQARWRIAEVESSLQRRWIHVRACQDLYDALGQRAHALSSRETTITW